MSTTQPPQTIVESDEEEDVQILNGPPISTPIHFVTRRQQRRTLDDQDFVCKDPVEVKLSNGDRIVIKLRDTLRSYETGDFLEVHGISNDIGGLKYLRCLPFRLVTCPSMAGMLGDSPNELFMIQQIYPGDSVHPSGYLLSDFCIQSLGRIEQVKIIRTNRIRYNSRVPSDPGTLYCRWKFTQVFDKPSRARAKDNRAIQEMFQKLQYHECSTGHGLLTAFLRAERDLACQLSPRYTPRIEQLEIPQRKITFFDAFCGAGFASAAMKKAGGDIVGALDADTNAQHNYKLNFPRTRLWRMTQAQFLSYVADEWKGRVDVLHASFPCKYVSPSHTIPGRNDAANFVAMLGLSTFLEKIMPRIVTMEQTSGLAELQKHRSILQSQISSLLHAGYDVQKGVLQFAAYGMPQKRRRLIIVAAA